MLDTAAGELVSFHDAATLIPSHPHPATVWRWAQSGVRGVKLESILIGGKRFTSREAIDRFLSSSNEDKKKAGLQPGDSKNDSPAMEGQHAEQAQS